MYIFVFRVTCRQVSAVAFVICPVWRVSADWNFVVGNKKCRAQRLFQPSHACLPSVLQGWCPRCDGIPEDGPSNGPNLTLDPSYEVVVVHIRSGKPQLKKTVASFSCFYYSNQKWKNSKFLFPITWNENTYWKLFWFWQFLLRFRFRTKRWGTDLYIISCRCNLEEEF